MVKRNPSCDGCVKCGDKLSGTTGCCCTHTCHAICVYLQGGCDDDGYCSCEEISSTYLLYDEETDSYHGSISCGDLVVDLEFVIKYCKEEEQCVICLISECASTDYGGELDGECDNQISCQPLIVEGTEACVGEVNDVFLEGGLEHTWDIDVSNCGDENCTSMQLKTFCTPRIFPEEVTNDDGVGCKGCQCLCRDLCISYSGTECSDGNQVSASDEGVWEFEVSACDSGQEDQNGRSIRIELQKNETTGLCELLVTASQYGEEDIEQIVALNDCPEIPLTTIYLNEEESEFWTFECWKCQGCTAKYCICECDNPLIAGTGFLIPDVLTIDYSFVYGGTGGGSGTAPLTLIQRPNANRSGPCVWEGDLVVTCNCGQTVTATYHVSLTLEPSVYNPPGYPLLCGWGLTIHFRSGGGACHCDGGFVEFNDQWNGPNSCSCDPILLTFHRDYIDSGEHPYIFDATISE